ncbi:hypothetical protein [Actinoplanes sp. NBRC 101535]|uniref:hypothetical protein n=1 Tax=Actinoplanes sp. NBRC 101535 TaxID=3032196 RepID=UPI0024A0155D|nr:hypothetical protein [Actinoplanes sp. NBRC 101535]GLY05294.1 hypothetical protein Acsp01_56730 [Actinoplanes sp. NBRC 101535]
MTAERARRPVEPVRPRPRQLSSEQVDALILIRHEQVHEPGELQPRQAADPSVRVAIVTAVGSLIVGGTAFAGALLTHDEPVAPSPDPGYCVTVYEAYRGVAEGDPGQASILTRPGPNGKSIVDADRSAVQCGVTNEVVIDLGNLPRPTPG